MIEAQTYPWYEGLAGTRALKWGYSRGLVLLALLAAILSVAGCGGGSETTREPRVNYRSSETFPVPPEIQPNVDFWRHVYGVWSRGQVAFHDDEHMGVIYEVARLPGPIHDGYTAYQKDWVRSRTSYYKDRLSTLERRLASGESLSPADKELLAKFEKAGGRHAIYGAAERVRSQRGLRERFRRGVEISGRYDQRFREVMRANGVPEDLAYLPHVESSFQTNARSSVGAAGVWQFMPSTGRLYNMDVNSTLDERLDPILCADGAARYLSDAYRKLRSWPLAITSYNHGVGGMTNAKAQYGDNIGRIVKDYNGKSFKFASRNFYSEFIAAREVARNAQRYFPEGVRYESPWPHDRIVLRGSMPADHVARHYGVSSGTLAKLNLHWRDPAAEGRALLPSGSTVWLPAGSTRRIASQPPAYSPPVMIARSEPERTSAPPARKPELVLARAEPRKPTVSKPAKAVRVSSTPAKSKGKVIKVAAVSAPKYHVVKPQETLYRVATLNGISVEKLRKLNKMGPNDNNIRPGQKLKVGV